MGYRSDLVIKCTNDVAPILYTEIRKQDLHPGSFSQDEKYTYITLDHLKWYDLYSDVQAINGLIESLGEDNKATMVRKGEDNNDIEAYGADPYELDLYYTVIVDYDGFDFSDNIEPFKAKHPELFI